MIEDLGWCYGGVAPVKKYKCKNCGGEFFGDSGAKYCPYCGSKREGLQ